MEIKQIRVIKTENGNERVMHIDEKTWNAIVKSNGAFGDFKLAPSTVINAKPVELVKPKVVVPEIEVKEEVEHTNSDLAYLRELAKEKGIKGYQVMGETTLKHKLNIK